MSDAPKRVWDDASLSGSGADSNKRQRAEAAAAAAVTHTQQQTLQQPHPASTDDTITTAPLGESAALMQTGAAASSTAPSAVPATSTRVCNECDATATEHCLDCPDDWCAECSAAMHAMKRTRMHRREGIPPRQAPRTPGPAAAAPLTREDANLRSLSSVPSPSVVPPGHASGASGWSDNPFLPPPSPAAVAGQSAVPEPGAPPAAAAAAAATPQSLHSFSFGLDVPEGLPTAAAYPSYAASAYPPRFQDSPLEVEPPEVAPLTPEAAYAILQAAMQYQPGYGERANPDPFRLRAGGDVYECTEWLGGGGFGAVWKAHKLGEQHRPLAVKFARLVDKEGLSTTSQQLRRMREPELQRELDHPNILRLRTSETYGDVCVLVLEYCAGGSLHDLIQQRGALSAAEARGFMQQLRDGLMLLRELKIIHRDLKPANLMLNADRTQLKIGDFGLARTLDGSSLTSAPVGTWTYMAPECMEGQPHDRSDLWSVGVILLEMLLGHEGIKRRVGTISDSADLPSLHLRPSHLSVADRALRCHLKTLPPSCVELLSSLLRRNPETRLSWSEFAECIWLSDARLAWDEAIFAASRVFIPPPPCSLSSNELRGLRKFLFRCLSHGMRLSTAGDLPPPSPVLEDIAAIRQARSPAAREVAFVVIASRLAGDEGRPSGWMQGQGARLGPLAISIGFHLHQMDIIKPRAIIRREGKLMLDLYPGAGRLVSLRLSIDRFHFVPPGSRYCLMHFLGTPEVRGQYFNIVRSVNMRGVWSDHLRWSLKGARHRVDDPLYPVAHLPWPNTELVERIRQSCSDAGVPDNLSAFGIDTNSQTAPSASPSAQPVPAPAAAAASSAGVN